MADHDKNGNKGALPGNQPDPSKPYAGAIISMDRVELETFLELIGLSDLRQTLENNNIGMLHLPAMTHAKLKAIGVIDFFKRTRLIGFVERYFRNFGLGINQAGALVLVNRFSGEFLAVSTLMKRTVVSHRGNPGGYFTDYEIIQIQRIVNQYVESLYMFRKETVKRENAGLANEKFLFHGSVFTSDLILNGYDERHSSMDAMFGAGCYFAPHSSKSNEYVFGRPGTGCPVHSNKSCYICVRQLLLNRVILGRCFEASKATSYAHGEVDHHSVYALEKPTGVLDYPEYIVYRGDQALPRYLITYRIVDPRK